VRYSNGVHYDSEPQRRPLFQRLIADGALPAGYVTDDGAVYSTVARISSKLAANLTQLQHISSMPPRKFGSTPAGSNDRVRLPTQLFVGGGGWG
jgi:hypothetical protein